MDYFFGDGLVEPTQWTTPPNLDLGGAGALDAVSIDFTGIGTETDAMWDSDGDGVADRVVLAHGTEDAQTFTDPGDGTWSVPFVGAGAGSAAAGGVLGGVGSLSPAALGGGSVAGGSVGGGSVGGLGSLGAGSLALGAIGGGSAQGIDVQLPALPELPPPPALPPLPNLCDVVCPDPVQGGIDAPAPEGPEPAPAPAPETAPSVEDSLAGDTDHLAGPDPVGAPPAQGSAEISAIQGGIDAGSAAAMGSLDTAALGSTSGSGVDAGSAAGSAAAGSLAAGSLGAGSAGGGSVGIGSVGAGSIGGGSLGGGSVGAGSLGAGSVGGAGLGVLSGSLAI